MSLFKNPKETTEGMKFGDYVSGIQDGSLLNNILFGKDDMSSVVTKKDVSDRELTRFYRNFIGDEFFSSYYSDDPTVMSFMLHPDWSSPLFNMVEDNPASAYNYLLNINQLERAERFKKFVKRFQDLVIVYKYFLQKLSGLGNIYEKKPNQGYIERMITIETLESIDLRVAAMVDDYNRSVYDYNEMKCIVPVNLLYFDMIISITEIRKFRTFVTTTNDAKLNYYSQFFGEPNIDGDGMLELNDFLGIYALKFRDCSMNFEQSAPFLGNLDNSSPSVATNSIRIVLGKLDFYSTNLDIFESIKTRQTVVIPNTSGLDPDPKKRDNIFFPKDTGLADGDSQTIWGALKDIAAKEAEKAVKNAVSQLGDAVAGAVDNLEKKVSNAVGELVNKYNPANMLSRAVDKGLTKLTNSVNTFINDGIDSIMPSLMNDGRQNANGKSVISGNGVYDPKNLSDSQNPLSTQISESKNDVLNPKETELSLQIDRENATAMKNRENILKIIMHGSDAEKFVRDTIINSVSNKKIE